MLVVDTPILDPNSLAVLIIGYIDKFHTVIFTIECLIKIIGLGFFKNTLRQDEIDRALAEKLQDCKEYFNVDERKKQYDQEL